MEGAEEPLEPGWEPRPGPLARLKSLLERESEAQAAGREAAYERPLEERVAAGTAIAGLRFVRSEPAGEQTLLVFSCDKNESRFRPGTRLRLSRGDPRSAVARLELVDDRHDGRSYLLRLSGPVAKPDALAGEAWVADEDVFELLDVQLEILRLAERASLDAWLEGAEPVPEDRPADGSGSPLAAELSGTLREAFERASRASPYFAVQGPPGSGKTHLLARLALHAALLEDARVLITAVSHQAIHHALGETYWLAGRLASSVPGLKALREEGFLKFGASKGANEGLPEGVRALPRAPARKRPMVAGATLYAAMRALGPDGAPPPFDLVLFDEAGQAPLVLALAARLAGARVVFIGDDAQLPPVVSLPPGEEAGELERCSALSLIRSRYGDPWMLTESRRLNEPLCSAVSDLFYGGRLSPSEEAAPRRLRLERGPAPEFAGILDPESPLVFVDVPHEHCRSVSEPEARWAAAIAAEARRCGLPAAEIGVIAPYRTQCNRIRFLLGGGRAGPVVSTVERFQGQEREMVVISLTSSKPAYLARLAAFLFDPHRLNVAVSRARTKVVLLGAREVLRRAAEESDPDSEATVGLRLFLRLLERARLEDGSRPPPPPAPAQEPAPEGAAFEPGQVVEHAQYGVGRVLSKSVQLIDERPEWINEVRFGDGFARLVAVRLCRPPMRAVGEA